MQLKSIRFCSRGAEGHQILSEVRLSHPICFQPARQAEPSF
jgi:hypothetical protein